MTAKMCNTARNCGSGSKNADYSLDSVHRPERSFNVEYELMFLLPKFKARAFNCMDQIPIEEEKTR